MEKCSRECDGGKKTLYRLSFPSIEWLDLGMPKCVADLSPWMAWTTIKKLFDCIKMKNILDYIEKIVWTRAHIPTIVTGSPQLHWSLPHCCHGTYFKQHSWAWDSPHGSCPWIRGGGMSDSATSSCVCVCIAISRYIVDRCTVHVLSYTVLCLF